MKTAMMKRASQAAPAVPAAGIRRAGVPAPVRMGPMQTRMVSARVASEDEVELLEKALRLAKERAAKAKAAPASAVEGGSEYKGKAFTVLTFNAISPVGLKKFPSGKYAVAGDESKLPDSPMAIMLRSHKLQESEVKPTVRGIVRCGAGTNNIPVARMTELGIPVFNTPGANANAVKELVICSLLLASRGIVEGNQHVNNVINVEENMDYDKIAKRIEKDKAKFVGCEIAGKTLGVVGLGAIGGMVVNAALALGMNVIGYDPVLSMDAAWRLPGDRMKKADKLEDLLKASDYITVHVPYIKDSTHHMLNAQTLSMCKPNVNLLNFARGEIIDGEAVKDMWNSGKLTGKYISDFADPYLQGHPKHIVLPHLGASTEEAEDNSAAMAAETIMEFLEVGTIRNSVNFPQTVLPEKEGLIGARLCIIHKNTPGVLGQITTFMGSKNVNIEQQINTSRGNIAYTVLDFPSIEDPNTFQDELASSIDEVISSRFIGNAFHDELGQPGINFYVKWAKN